MCVCVCSLHQVETAEAEEEKGREEVYSIELVYSGLRDHMPSTGPLLGRKNLGSKTLFSPIGLLAVVLPVYIIL